MNAEHAQALRYLGVKQPDAALEAMVAEGFAALAPFTPRHCMEKVPVAEALSLFESRALADYLSGCGEAVLLAATLGAQADGKIRQAEAVDMLRASVLHACAAAKIEAYIDAVHAEIPGANRPRFSPGFADFALSAQQALLSRIRAPRLIGLHLTDASMLVPAKSVTAVLGIGPALPDCPTHKCARCAKADCAYRGEMAPCQ